MGIMVPETCRASNKICNKNHLLHLVGILFPHIHVFLRVQLHPTTANKRMVKKVELCGTSKFLLITVYYDDE